MDGSDLLPPASGMHPPIPMPTWMEVMACEQQRWGARTIWRWRGRLRQPPAQILQEASAAWHPLGYTPLLRREGAMDCLIAAPLGTESHRWRRLAWPAAILTALTMLISAALLYGDPLAASIHALAIGVILLAHEGGHLLAARRLRLPVTAPLLLPWPLPPLGTLGAIILPDRPPANRRALALLALAGPLTGMALSLLLLGVGLTLSDVRPIPADRPVLREGNSLLYAGIKHVLFGRSLPSGGEDVMLHPLAFAAWLGVLLNALSLLPLGMLDGGQICSALAGRRRATHVSRGVGIALMIASPLWPGWAIMGLLGLVIPPPGAADDLTPPPRRLAAGALAALGSVILTLPLQPFRWE